MIGMGEPKHGSWRRITSILVLTVGIVVPGLAQRIDSLEKVLRNHLNDTTYIQVHHQIAEESSKTNPEKALAHAQAALSFAQTRKLLPEALKSHLVFGEVMLNQSKYVKARTHFRIVIANAQADQPMLLEAESGMATSFLRVSEFDSGKYFVDKAQARNKGHNPSAEGELLATLGSLYLIKDDREKALTCYVSAYKLLVKHRVNETAQSMLLNNIGNVEYLLQHYDKATEYAIQAKKLAEQKHYEGTINYSNKLLGRIYRKQKKYDDALAVYHEALKRYAPAHLSRDMSEVHLSIGNIHWDQGKMDAAMDAYFKALDDARRVNDNALKGYIFFAIASAYEQMNRPAAALTWLDSVTSMSRKVAIPYQLLDSYELRSLIFKASGDYKKAYEFANLHRVLNDSLVSAENRRVIDELEARFQNEKKKKEILDLQQENELLAYERRQQVILFLSIISILLLGGLAAWYYDANRRRKADLKKLMEVSRLNERIAESQQMALRLQMNPHFIFNCITAIDALIVNDNRKGASDFLNKFAKLLRYILENARHTFISLDKDLACLELYIQLEQKRFENGFEYAIHVDRTLTDQPPSIPPLLLQPFVENAILHGIRHRQGKKIITITLSADDNGLITAVIRDNGVGRKKSAEMNATRGTHHSIGLDVTNQRLRLMEETQHVETSSTIIDLYAEDGEPLGTEVRITFDFSVS